MKEHQNKKQNKNRRLRRRWAGLLLLAGCCLAAILLLDNPPAVQSPQRTATHPAPGAEDADEPPAPQKEEDWNLILVNKWNAMPEDYQVELVELDNGQSVDKRIYSFLQQMFDDARRQRIYPVVASGYRTAEKQQSLMDQKIEDYKAEGYSPEDARVKAEAWVAIPGTSEHQLGLGVDINADGVHSAGEEVYQWLEENSHRYGFIRRYAADKTEITGVIHEPWHFRYVGVAAAEEIWSEGLCLEEYLGRAG